MWHLSMKLFDIFDQTSPHTLGKIIAKSQSLTMSPPKVKVKFIANKAKDNNLGNKNFPPLKKLSLDSQVTDV